jgi:hypothetical protein
MNEPLFELSFEYPNVDPTPPFTFETESFILHIDCANGDVYALTVWTDAYLARVREHDRETGDRLTGQYLIPPDLIIASDDIVLIERTVADLIGSNSLRPEWLIPDELTACLDDPGEYPEEDDDFSNPWLVAPVRAAGHADCGCCHLHRIG